METFCDLFSRCIRLRREDDWNKLTRGYGGRFRRILRARLHNAGLSSRRVACELDDHVQELYLHLLSLSSQDFRGTTNGQAWSYLQVVSRNLVQDLARVNARNRRRRLRYDLLPEATATPEQTILAREELDAHLDACRRVARRRPRTCVRLQMRILQLACAHGHSSREVARLVSAKITPGNVDCILHRLRRGLAKEGIELRRRHRRIALVSRRASINAR